MYIFGVYECVFSVVAVGWQPILCKGLKQTIIQSSWIRQTEEATSIDDTANHNTHFSGAIIYSVDYSSTFSFLLTLLLFYQPKATSGFVYYFIWKSYFQNATLTLGRSLAARRVSLRATVWRMAAVLLWLVFLWRVRVDSLQSRAHCLVWWVALL